jgi:hypothetical protein
MTEAAAHSPEDTVISASDVIDLYELLEQHDIKVWLALLGKQTGLHGDWTSR